jgi:hypothetical protein
MKTRIDMTGGTYGQLVCLGFSHTDAKGNAHWNFLCQCGFTKTANGYDVRAGKIVSCGHVKASAGARNQLRHGHATRQAKTATYTCWRNMIARCYEPASERFASYGGRGISVCDEWRADFAVFLRDMGEKPAGLTLERDDVNGNYEPGNCRWATWAEQRLNTTRTKR